MASEWFEGFFDVHGPSEIHPGVGAITRLPRMELRPLGASSKDGMIGHYTEPWGYETKTKVDYRYMSQTKTKVDYR